MAVMISATSFPWLINEATELLSIILSVFQEEQQPALNEIKLNVANVGNGPLDSVITVLYACLDLHSANTTVTIASALSHTMTSSTIQMLICPMPNSTEFILS